MADMNVTPSRPNLTPIIWDSEFFVEYLRRNQFSVYFGTTENAMIQIQSDLTRKNGDSIMFPMVRNLVGAGVTGNTILEGNEEILNARSLKLTVTAFRHAVAVSDWDTQKSVIDLRNAARTVLINWSTAELRNDIISSLGAITGDAYLQVSYGAATAAQRNTWTTNNWVAPVNRVLYGHLKSNGSSNVMATALATIAPASDLLSSSIITLAKRMARTASPAIRPLRINNDEEWYVMFVPSLAFRDLMKDTVITNALQYAWNRGSDNPLFTAGDILFDGVIIREIPELPILTGVGSGPSDVGACYLCGAQAVGIAYAQRTTSTTNTRDYGYMHGVGIQEMRGVGKLRFGTDPTTDENKPVDNGIVTVFVATPADA